MWLVVGHLCLLQLFIGQPFVEVIEPQSTLEYELQVMAVALVMIAIFSAASILPRLIKGRYVRRNGNPLSCYALINTCQVVELGFVAFVCEILYFLSNNMSFGICTFMPLCVTFLYYPSERSIRAFVETFQSEEN